MNVICLRHALVSSYWFTKAKRKGQGCSNCSHTPPIETSDSKRGMAHSQVSHTTSIHTATTTCLPASTGWCAPSTGAAPICARRIAGVLTAKHGLPVLRCHPHHHCRPKMRMNLPVLRCAWSKLLWDWCHTRPARNRFFRNLGSRRLF